MFEFVHARIAWFAAGLLIWSTYGALQDDSEAQAIKKSGRVEIRDELVALRPANAGPPRLRDPFQLEQAEGEPLRETPAVAGGLTDHTLAGLRWASEHAASLCALVAPFTPALSAWQLGRRSVQRLRTLPDASDAQGEPPSFRLRLEAVSRADGVGAARLNGRVYRAGDLIPDVDPLAPPRVQAIEGVSVYVLHRGRVLTLDLDASPTLQVGAAAVVEVAQPGAASAAPAPGERALTPREKNRLQKAGKLP